MEENHEDAGLSHLEVLKKRQNVGNNTELFNPFAQPLTHNHFDFHQGLSQDEEYDPTNVYNDHTYFSAPQPETNYDDQEQHQKPESEYNHQEQQSGSEHHQQEEEYDPEQAFYYRQQDHNQKPQQESEYHQPEMILHQRQSEFEYSQYKQADDYQPPTQFEHQYEQQHGREYHQHLQTGAEYHQEPPPESEYPELQPSTSSTLPEFVARKRPRIEVHDNPDNCRAAGKESIPIPTIQNVVATVDMCTHLRLREISDQTLNSEYNPHRFAALIMRIFDPKSTALIFSTGKMVVTGAKSAERCRTAAKKFAKIIRKLGYDIHFNNFQIQNIVGSVDLGANVKLEILAASQIAETDYEPELFPGLVYRVEKPKIVILVFVSGKIVLTGAKHVCEIEEAFNLVYPVIKAYTAAPRPEQFLAKKKNVGNAKKQKQQNQQNQQIQRMQQIQQNQQNQQNQQIRLVQESQHPQQQ